MMTYGVSTDLVRTGSGSSRAPDEWTCEAIALNLAAATYRQADIDRVLQVLAEVISTTAAEGPPHTAVLTYHVSRADVRIEVVGRVIDRIVMRPGTDVVWARYQRRGAGLMPLFYRVVH